MMTKGRGVWISEGRSLHGGSPLQIWPSMGFRSAFALGRIMLIVASQKALTFIMWYFAMGSTTSGWSAMTIADVPGSLAPGGAN